MFHMLAMETVTIRELRQNWPGIERRLRATRAALLVTRDGEPVAQVSLPPTETNGPGPGFSAAAHRQWRTKHWGRHAPKTDSGRWLDRTREERRSDSGP
jgi:antitoxin (DNA-binding transcriptional repressor) of toxin-antitoxin stability system